MQTMSLEDHSRDSNCERAGTERGHDHDVERLPNAPTISVVHAANWAKTGHLPVARKQKGERNQCGQHFEWPVSHRDSINRYEPFPASLRRASFCVSDVQICGAHSCALNPVSFSCSCASSTTCL